MSFPALLLHEAPGRELQTYTNRRWPVGTVLKMRDGRTFQFALKSGAAAVAGDLQQAAANSANHLGRTPVGAAGSKTVSVPLGATAVAADEYYGGYLLAVSGGGLGYSYPIGTHDAVLSAGTFTVPLLVGYSVQVAFSATPLVDLIRNPFYSVIVAPTTLTQVPVGVAVKPIAANGYGWIQTRGPAAVKTAGTVVIGNKVVVSAATAGAVEAADFTAVAPLDMLTVGWVMRVNAAAAMSLIMLDLNG
jgi:hypothetical protein